jgi:hypothetical protein
VDAEGGKAKFFALADFGVGSGEKFHGQKIPFAQRKSSGFDIFFRQTFSIKKLDTKKTTKKLDTRKSLIFNELQPRPRPADVTP